MASRESNEVIEPRVNFEKIPLSALRPKSRERLSILLNPEKVLVSEDGHFRDWRGIFSLSGLAQSEYTLISQSHDKTGTLIDLWIRKNSRDEQKVSFSQLQHCFELIDRYDIHDDTQSLFSDDALAFLSRAQSADAKNSSTIFELVKAEPDNDIITVQDAECRGNGLSLPVYDALVIYHDRDIEFATELIERMEHIGYKLCAKDRDLMPGLSFESDAMLNLLAKRCNRLIIIVSKAFLSSPMQIFITNFAQALGIENGQRKIIPCLLEPCDLPQMLRYCFRLDYYRNNKLFDFWDKLDKSLRVYKRDSKPQAIEGSNETSSKNTSATPPPPLLYKFSETSSTEVPEKMARKSPDDDRSEEETRKLTFLSPKSQKLRSASSMVGLDTIPNGNSLQNSSKHSHSTLWLNGATTETDSAQNSSKLKRKKWYSLFLPPRDVKIKSKPVEQMVLEDEEEGEGGLAFKEESKKKSKKLWFRSKKKRDKKEKVAAL